MLVMSGNYTNKQFSIAVLPLVFFSLQGVSAFFFFCVYNEYYLFLACFLLALVRLIGGKVCSKIYVLNLTYPEHYLKPASELRLVTNSFRCEGIRAKLLF